MNRDLPAPEAGLADAALSAMDGGDSAHDPGHLRRVRDNALAIAAEEGGDTRVLTAAAWLHDLVNLPKSHPDRARASGLSAKAAEPVLVRLGYSAPERAAIAHAIAAHSFSAGIPCETLEARILQDADRLDSLGAIGIARTFAVSGALGRPLFDPQDPFAEHRTVDDAASAIDHFATKLLRLGERMQTATGRRMARTRTVRMRAFLAELGAELGTPLPDGFGSA